MPIIGADDDKHYRNKLEFTFSDKRYLLQDEIGTGLREETQARSLKNKHAFAKQINTVEINIFLIYLKIFFFNFINLYINIINLYIVL